MIISVFTDGGARGNPGPAAIGVVIKVANGNVLYQLGKRIGKTTNNVAEYTALLEALSWLAHYKQKENIDGVRCFLDSELVVSQLTGLYKIKNPKLAWLIMKIHEKKRGFSFPVTYHHIPREKNLEADRLVNQALDESP